VSVSVDVRQEFLLPSSTARFSVSAHSDRGAVRRVNEDSFFASAPLFLVADGMGGHSYGDRASQAAVAAFSGAFTAGEPASAQRVLETIRLANDAVRAVSQGLGEAGISGTTITGIAFVDVGDHENYHWMTFNVGDSRVYGWDGRALVQVSVDHSAVQELIDLGSLSRTEAQTHPERNVVTRALGADAEVDPDIWLLPARGHQTFLLCSDGLTKELPDDEIARIIAFHNAEALRDNDELPVTLAERLVKAAIAAGGSDNVTVLVVESDVVGVRSPESNDDTIDRGSMPRFLEETRPRR
jgi:serine/threonine protein phosphatase PrpC